ncbi:MAG: DNA polymerase III subunit alpha [Chloroflexota bacterium]|nr:DNA polymerase III subunit alpha [Chloroflexota bacterium]
MAAEFVHLHLHSDYSLLDGLGKIKNYVSMAKEYGMPALALSDHGVLYGAFDMYSIAKKQGIKPIIGCEMYVAARTMHDKQGKLDSEYYHLLVLARDYEGYQNLLKLVSLAHMEGYYYKPRIDHDTLARHSKGLIVTSACLGGEVSQLLLRGHDKEARERADKYRSIVGRENYFIEVQDHPMEEQQVANRKLIELASDLEIPLVATCDVHYPRKEDAEIHDVLLCVQTGRMVSDENRMRMSADSFYLRSPQEMERSFGELPEALSNTLAIAEMCDISIPTGKWILPHYDVPEGHTPETYLRELCEQGLSRRYETVTPKIRERLEYELDIIEKKGYPTYMLIVQDFVNWARQQEIAVTSRGSAAGSLVSYLINITSADPLEYDLPFERFLTVHRPSPPDIDMDFEDSRREEVIQYVTRKYGQDKVAQIITFGTMEARAAVRDVGRVLGLSYGDCDAVAKMIQQGSSLADTLDSSSALREWRDRDPQIRRLLDYAARLEGVTRHASTHAAGVIISREPLMNYAPVQKEASGNKPLIQYNMTAAESIGLLKMDFLGLANLSILGRAVKTIKQTTGQDINLDMLPLDDATTYELLSSGETTGVFQLESAGMRRYIKDLKPTNIRDIAAMISLYRPGPMDMIPTYIERKHDTSKVSYLVPQLESILKNSFGVLVYQDDILQLSIEVAGYTWEEADKLRKAVGKKIKEELDAQREKFVKGCQAHGGLSAAKANELWEWMEPFARYGFGKAHAAAYALVAYQTAYLKANYTSEYMSAFLTVAVGNAEKIVAGISECKRMGIDVLPPDINRSEEGFALEPGEHGEGKPVPIRFGLGAIKNVGSGLIQAILNARGKLPEKQFKSLDHLCQQVDGRLVNKRVLESLIKAGAMDALGTRAQLLAVLDDAMAIGQRAQKASGAGQMSLFGSSAAHSEDVYVPSVILPAVPDTPREEQLSWEKEMLGLYITEHPLTAALAGNRSERVSLMAEVGKELVGQSVQVIGMLTGTRVLTTKKKQSMLVGKLEDLTGSIDLVAFPESYEKHRELLRDDAILEIAGKLDERNDNLQLILDSAQPYRTQEEDQAEGAEGGPPPEEAEQREDWAPDVDTPQELRVLLPVSGDLDADVELMHGLYRLLKRYPGPDRVTLQLSVGQRSVVIAPHSLDVRYSAALQAELEGLLGGRHWRVLDLPRPAGPDKVA